MERNCQTRTAGSSRRIWASLFLIFATLISSCSALQQPARPPAPILPSSTGINIIPQPTSVTPTNGYFEFRRDTKIIATDATAVKASTALNNLLLERYAFMLTVIRVPNSPNSITFSTANVPDQSGAGEGYSLKIKPGAIHITGSERGMFYGIQSLLQLFPPDSNGEAKIPAADISDSPRFRYRGMHLDVARHFMPVAFVKKVIRLISRYKYNYFHWHLTDDQGWRIEIKKYPRLTEIGSRRSESQIGRKGIYHGDNTPVEGFYTQDEILDVVEYARQRYVTIIPEIDLPGHTSAALASYPALSCVKNYPHQVQKTWGGFPDVLCPTEFTFQFLENVFSEVIELFPNSPYIHLGGDEVKTDLWRGSKPVQDLMKANGLSSYAAVQAWFLNRVGSYVKSKGKKIIVWDDMVNVGSPPEATVMYWRASAAARRNTPAAGQKLSNAVIAARMKHEVIMTPDTDTYLDHPEAEPGEPLRMYDSPITLDEVYWFEPVPAELSQADAKQIIGGQGCVWTEMLKKPTDVEDVMFPRALALAEMLWSKPENKDFPGFKMRLNKELLNLDLEPVNYRKPRGSGFGERRSRAKPKPPPRAPVRRAEPSP